MHRRSTRGRVQRRELEVPAGLSLSPSSLSQAEVCQGFLPSSLVEAWHLVAPNTDLYVPTRRMKHALQHSSASISAYHDAGGSQTPSPMGSALLSWLLLKKFPSKSHKK